MKKYFFLFALALLPMVFTSCGDDENITPQNQESGNPDKSDNPNTPTIKEIVVEVDENGNANDGHHFRKIDNTNFYIDNIKYTVSQENLTVSGYEQANFSGEANIITTLKYNRRAMSVTSINGKAFENCKILTSVTIPNSVTSIGEDAFFGCSCLTSVAIDCTTIDSWFDNAGFRYVSWFSNITSIKELIIGNNVTSIGKWAFFGCSSLILVSIGNSVTSIGDFAFYNCSNLTSITIGNSVTSIGECTFLNCSGLKSVTIDCPSVGDWFKNLTSIKEVTIGNSVTSISEDAFSGCSGLSSIIVEKDNSKFDSREKSNAIIETATNTLLHGCKNTTIPNSVTSVGRAAFRGCKDLTSITIPNNVTSIGGYAFEGCSGLTSITISNSVTEIGYEAFRNCSSLTSITIPNSVTSIDIEAFWGCSGLSSITCYAINPPSVTSYTFSGFSISSATLRVPAESVDTYKSTDYWKNFGSIVAIE